MLLLCGAIAIVIARRHIAPPARTTSVLPTPTTPPATTDAPFPSDTASDVVSYADHVALVTAIAEVDAPTTGTTSSPGGEHVVMRQVTFRVDHTLWTRPDAPTAPKQMTALWWGWLLRDGKRTPFIVHGAPVVFLGAQYVMPIAYDGTTYSAIQPFAVFRVGGDRITPEEQDTPLAQDLADASLNEVRTVFASARPDPVSERYRDRLPRARLAAVLAARGTGKVDGAAPGR